MRRRGRGAAARQDRRARHRHLVGRQRACLVGADDCGAAERLNARQRPHNRVVLGHLACACAAGPQQACQRGADLAAQGVARARASSFSKIWQAISEAGPSKHQKKGPTRAARGAFPGSPDEGGGTWERGIPCAHAMQ
eukprot:240401-Chlamydomonas_euryale.AAC.10